MITPKIKICGMKYPDNIREIIALQPDYMGFIFYPPSKRFVDDSFADTIVSLVPTTIKKVGVFVDTSFITLAEKIKLFQLDFVQLHGSETVEFCREVQQMGVGVIKAFGINSQFDLNIVQNYQDFCDYFLFDTQTEKHGGSGLKFDWNLLEKVSISKPFFLSGGIGPTDAESILNNSCLKPFAIDINSRFETEPAIKDIDLLKKFIKEFRKNEL